MCKQSLSGLEEQGNCREAGLPAVSSFRTTMKSSQRRETSLLRSKNESTVTIKNTPPAPRPPSGRPRGGLGRAAASPLQTSA